MSQAMVQNQPQGKNTFEVLRESVTRGMDEAGSDQFYTALVKMIREKKAKPVQVGNTVFLMLNTDSSGNQLPEGEAEVHTFSTESPDNAIKRYQVLPNTARQLGYRKISFICPTSSLAMLLDALFRKARLSTNMTATQINTNNKVVPIFKQEVML